MRRSTLFAGALLALLLPVFVLLVFQVSPSSGAQEPISGTPTYQAYFPVIFGPVPTPTPTNTPTPTLTPTASPTPGPTTEPSPVTWDPRLDVRSATLVPANVAPGQGYWKVVKGVWYDLHDFHPMGVGDHDIAFDVVDASGTRQVGQSMKITWWIDGSCSSTPSLALEGPEVLGVPTTFCTDFAYSQAKPGEPYAGTYPMYHIAPTYRIQVNDGNPSEAVDGLGMGSIEQPYLKIHTSYGFVWRWTIAGNEGTTATPTTTPSDTATPGPTQPTDTPTVGPTSTPVPPLVWDPRLTQRGAVLATAQATPGQGYWRLTTGVWYDVSQQPFANQGLILVDTRDASGARKTGVSIQISDLKGTTVQVITTEAKPNELYATNFPMWQTAPAYIARPIGAPADAVLNLGLGSIANPNSMDPTRYGLVWQWTIAGGGVEPLGTATPSPTPTSTATAPVASSYVFTSFSVPACRPQAGGTWFSGVLTLNGQPANGYRVVFSDKPDGVPITQPAISGPHTGYPYWDPGYYSHIISTNQALIGDWYVWIVDQNGTRISVIAHWHSSGPSFSDCSDATVNFNG